MSLTNAFSILSDPSLVKAQGFIDGKWVHAADGKTFSVTNPATDEELGTVPDMGVKEVKQAIDAAATAFKTWSQTTAKHRHDILKKFFDLMHEHVDDLGLIITLENGKTKHDSVGEVHYGATFLEWFAEEAVRTYGGDETIPCPSPQTRTVVIKQPLGVAAAVTPWNFPSAMITRKVGPALAAGCTMVLKPAPETPYSALALAELARRAGVPDGVLNVVTTFQHVKEVGLELCESKLVKKLTFTGSTAVAKLLYKQAAGTMKRVSIEAGGNSPFIVFDDADIDEVMPNLLFSKFWTSGQTCIGTNRIYVQSSIYDRFAARLTEAVKSFRMGDGLQEGITHGPLIHSRAVAKVEQHVNDAIQRGATLLTGGARLARPGSFFAPTVLSNVPSTAQLACEETFGPLAALIRFETEEEVVALANATDMGLASYFFSRDVGRVWRVAEALEAGMVGANSIQVAMVSTPFGGIKESGLGREGSHGIEEFLNTKLIAIGGV